MKSPEERGAELALKEVVNKLHSVAQKGLELEVAWRYQSDKLGFDLQKEVTGHVDKLNEMLDSYERTIRHYQTVKGDANDLRED